MNIFIQWFSISASRLRMNIRLAMVGNSYFIHGDFYRDKREKKVIGGRSSGDLDNKTALPVTE